MKATIPARPVIKLATIKEFDPDREMFRRTVSTDNGAVDLLAMKSGQKIDTHVALADVRMSVIDGHLHVIMDGTDLHLSAGDGMLTPSGTPHLASDARDTRFLLFKLK